MANTLLTHRIILDELVSSYQALSEVKAVTVGGSLMNEAISIDSDIDLIVYFDNKPPPVESRRTLLIDRGVKRQELDNLFWDNGDEWQEPSGEWIDVIYRQASWIETQLESVLVRHEASIGYTTCFWHNVLSSKVLFDTDGWFGGLQKKAAIPYPEPLRQAIITKNYPILRDTISSYKNQIRKAVRRKDIVSVNHRLAGFVASYFDVLLAINRVTHPGEKRLISLAKRDCKQVPENIDAIERLLLLDPHDWTLLEQYLDALVDGLEKVTDGYGSAQ